MNDAELRDMTVEELTRLSDRFEGALRGHTAQQLNYEGRNAVLAGPDLMTVRLAHELDRVNWAIIERGA